MSTHPLIPPLIHDVQGSSRHPTLSVILSVLTFSPLLPRVIESVLGQIDVQAECIVIDASGHELGQEWALHHPSIHYIQSEAPSHAKARNQGLQVAQGDFVIFLDATDVFVDPSSSAERIARFKSEPPQVGLVNSGYQVIDEQGKRILDVEPWVRYPRLTLASWLRQPLIQLSALTFRRAWLIQAGGFSRQFQAGEASHLVRRLALMGCRAVWLPHITIQHHSLQYPDVQNTQAHREESIEPRVLSAYEAHLDFFRQPNVPEWILNQEPTFSFIHLVTWAWHCYQLRCYGAMVNCLTESLFKTRQSKPQVITTWIQRFQDLAQQTQTSFNAYTLSQLPEWQHWVTEMLVTEFPRVSIVIPSYNGAQFLEETLDSLFRQTYRNFEIIVVDDGSTDSTRQLLDPYIEEKAIRYIYQENQGLSGARNRGIQASRGQLIAFLDADDLFLPTKLEEQVAVFDQDPTIDLVQTGWTFVDSKGSILKDAEFWKSAPHLTLDIWLTWGCVLPSALMIKRAWLQRALNFDRQFSQNQDLDLVIRLALMGCRSQWIPRSLVHYRQHEGSMMRNSPKQMADLWAVVNSIYARPDLPDVIRRGERANRYYKLIWTAWYVMVTNHAAEMLTYLRRSSFYTRKDPIEIILDWTYAFNTFFEQSYRGSFDAWGVSRLPEWQTAVHELLQDPQPLVSIIIPTYNCAQYLQQAIESVVRQTYRRIELIIVDDGSLDDSYDVIRPYLSQIRYYRRPHGGVSRARNYGIARANGSYIAFLDADDYFLTADKIAHQVDCFRQYPEVGIVNSGYRVVDRQGSFFQDVDLWRTADPLTLDKWILKTPVLPSAMLFQRQWLRQVGGFDPNLRAGEDLDLVLRLVKEGCQAIWLQEITTCYRQHPTSSLRRIHTIAQDYLTVHDKFFAQSDLPQWIRHLEPKARFSQLIWLAWRCLKVGQIQLMIAFLDQSLSYSPRLQVKTVLSWIHTFEVLDDTFGVDHQPSVKILEQLPEWQTLVRRVLFGSAVSSALVPQATLIEVSEPPLISIVMPAYNAARYISESLQSIQEQTYSNYEILVVDDGSSDNTVEVLDPWMDTIRYIYQENQGPSAARNEGIRQAQGDYIAFLDSDDLYYSTHLAGQIEHLIRYPQLAFVVSGWESIDSRGRALAKVEPWAGLPQLDTRTLLIYKPVLPSAMMFRHEWLNRVGGFDHRLRQAEDLDLVMRLCIEGCQADWVRAVTIGYRLHSGNATGNVTALANQYELVVDKFFSRLDLPPSIKALERRSRYQSYAWLAWRCFLAQRFAEMSSYLLKSSQFTPYSRIETILDWLALFTICSDQYGRTVDALELSRLEGWRRIVDPITVSRSSGAQRARILA